MDEILTFKITVGREVESVSLPGRLTGRELLSRALIKLNMLGVSPSQFTVTDAAGVALDIDQPLHSYIEPSRNLNAQLTGPKPAEAAI